MFKRFWQDLIRWFSYYKVIRNTYDFDYSSLLKVEYHQLTQIRDSISRYRNSTNFYYDLRNMNWALACLKIILEDGCAYSNRVPGFFTVGPDKNGYYTLEPNPEHKWILPVYVNDRNYKRFWKYYKNTPELEVLNKDNLRIEKAWYLYHKIRLEHLREFWD